MEIKWDYQLIAVTRNCPFPSLLSSPMSIHFRLEDSSFACKTERKSGNILPENMQHKNYKLLLKLINFKNWYCLLVKNSKAEKEGIWIYLNSEVSVKFAGWLRLWNFVTYTYTQPHTNINTSQSICD